MALASPVAWEQSLHRIICLPGSSLSSFAGMDLGLTWSRSQAPKMVECREGADGLLAAAVCWAQTSMGLFPTLFAVSWCWALGSAGLGVSALPAAGPWHGGCQICLGLGEPRDYSCFRFSGCVLLLCSCPT